MTKPIIQGIDVVYIHSRDPDLRQWYTDMLGLRPGYGDPHWQEFAMPSGTRFALDVPGVPPSPVEQQPVMVSFGVQDIHQAVEVLQSRGVKFVETASGTVFDVGPTLVASFQDGAGHWMQLSQRKNTPQPTIRTQLQAGDIGAIVQWHGAWYGQRFGWGPQFETYVAQPLSDFVLRENLRERLWIADLEGAVAGAIAIVEASPDTAQLRWFFIDDTLRGQGWGHTLIQAAIEFATEQAYQRLMLWTVSGLDAAMHLYEHYGFTAVETHTGSPWGSPVTEVQYSRDL